MEHEIYGSNVKKIQFDPETHRSICSFRVIATTNTHHHLIYCHFYRQNSQFTA